MRCSTGVTRLGPLRRPSMKPDWDGPDCSRGPIKTAMARSGGGDVHLGAFLRISPFSVSFIYLIIG